MEGEWGSWGQQADLRRTRRDGYLTDPPCGSELKAEAERRGEEEEEKRTGKEEEKRATAGREIKR